MWLKKFVKVWKERGPIVIAKNVGAGILGLGMYVPERLVTNDDLASIVDTNDEWIYSRTGMKERYFSSEGQATSDLAIEAGKRALADANVNPEELDLIIVATCTSDHICPSTAALVQHGLGAVNAGAFDISAACSGFVYSFTVASQMIISGLYKKILVIGAEAMSKFLNEEDRGTLILFGDGAGAAVVGEVEAGYGYLSSHLGADGSGRDSIYIPAGGSREPLTQEVLEKRRQFFTMSGTDVFKFAVKMMGETAKKTMEKGNLQSEDISMLIPHQANMRIIQASAKRLGLPDEKVYVNIHKYGNTSGASIPIALCEARNEGKIKEGDVLLCVGFGSGLTWAGCAMRWGKGGKKID